MAQDHDNYISVFAIPNNGIGTWQAIGYYKDQHVAAFGSSPQDALEKAMADYAEPADDGMDLV